MNRLIAPVTGLKFIEEDHGTGEASNRYLFAAIGNQVHIFLDGAEKPCTIEPIFPPEYRIHGFSDVANGRMIIYGGRIVALARINFAKNDTGIRLVERREFPDWVWDVHWLPGNGVLAVACGHSTTYICDAENLDHFFKLQSEEKELTWSTTLFTDLGELFAVAGSSFGDVLSWRVLSGTLMEKLLKNGVSCFIDMKEAERLLPVHRMQAHDGPIMRLTISEDRRYMCTGSVDRSVRVWKREQSECVACGGWCFTHLLTHYGHLARVWDVCFTQGIGVVSVGEDHACRVWGEKASLEKARFYGHSGRNIWRVAVSRGVVATGGEDGGVVVRSLQGGITTGPFQLPRFESPRKKGLFKECGRSIIAIDDTTFIITTDYGRILRGHFEKGDVNWVVVFSQGTAFTPCSLVVHGEVIVAGRTDGSVIALRNGVLIGSMQIEGMVMGVFANAMKGDLDVLISSPRGCVSHYHIASHDTITLLARYEMRHVVKSSLVTAGCVIREQRLVITGDRGGRVHTYVLGSSITDVPPDQTVRHPSQTVKVHKDRVSTITRTEGRVQTTSFDGCITHVDTTASTISVRVRKWLPKRTDTLTCAKDGFVFGVHGADGVLWDSRRREVVRANIGNWRRGHDVRQNGVVYWRGGVCRTRCDDTDWGTDGGLGGRVNAMCATGQGVVACGSGVGVFRGGHCVQLLKGHRSSVHGVASGVLNGTAVLVSVGGLDELLVHHLSDGWWKVEYAVTYEAAVRCRLVCAEVCGEGVFVGRSDGSVLRLDGRARRLRRVWQCDGGALCLAWEGGVLAAGDTTGGVNVREGGAWRATRAHEGGVNAVRHFRGGLLTGGDDGWVRFHARAGGAWAVRWQWQAHVAGVTGLAVRGGRAASVAPDQRVVEWGDGGPVQWRMHAVADAACAEFDEAGGEVVIGGIGMCGVKL